MLFRLNPSARAIKFIAHKNIINEDVKEEKKINISDEIKKNDVTNEIIQKIKKD